MTLAACDTAGTGAADLNAAAAAVPLRLALDDTNGVRVAVANAVVSREDLAKRVQSCDGLVDVGLKLPQQQSAFSRGKAALSPQVLQQIGKAVERAPGVELLDIDPVLAVAQLRVSDPTILDKLTASALVDFVEPGCFTPIAHVSEQSTDDLPEASQMATSASDPIPFFTCGTKGTKDRAFRYASLYGHDYISEDHYTRMNLQWAWKRSIGRGIKVGVVGTGRSGRAPQLMGQFTDGAVQNRTMEATYHWNDYTATPWHDDCGHESKLMANIAAPLDGRGTVGIAHGASIYSTRVDDDVLVQVNSRHVANGIRGAADADSRVINLALGSRHRWSRIVRAVEYAYDHENQPLLFGAAGTSFSWSNDGVAWPAQMPEVVAVTGVDDDYTPCSKCHFGPEVEFGVRTDQPTLHPYSPGSLVNSGGSSHATSTMSALAALVWSRYPGWTRRQVLARLRSSTPRYQSGSSARNDETGWGSPDASCAVGGLCRAKIQGLQVVEQAGSYTYRVVRTGNQDANVSYRWQDGSTGTSIRLNLAPLPDRQQYIHLTVTMTDTYSGQTFTDGQTVIVRQAGQSCDFGISCEG